MSSKSQRTASRRAPERRQANTPAPERPADGQAMSDPFDIEDGALDGLCHSLGRDTRIRLNGFLKPVEVERLRDSLGGDAPWWRTFNQREKSWELGPESLAVLDSTGTAQIEGAVHDGARSGFQYYYETIRVSETPDERAHRALPVDALIDRFNSRDGIAFWRRLTGNPRVSLVDGQATRYLPGDFLTRHTDFVDGKNRVAAYVLGLSPRWQAEWGGLLLFHGPDGEVTHGFVPRFNTLNVFTVPQNHSVSVVAPFAPEPRVAITGWIRTPG